MAANRLTADAQEATERELSSAEQHPAELASETIGLEIDHSVLQHAELEFLELEAAVKRVDTGSYGKCEACGKPISEARLEAIPTATVLHRGPGKARSERAAQRALAIQSVAEVALPGEHHRHAQRIGGFGDLGVVLASARVDDRAHARPCRGSRGRRASGRTRPTPRPLRLSASPARATASSEDSTRDIWPAPTPTAMPSCTITTALDLTCRHTRHAISRSRHSASSG